jgi:hypothetical protein
MSELDLLGWLPAWTRALLDQRVTNTFIAVATAVNVLVAWYTGQKTREAAEAGKAAAQAALQSAQCAEKQADIAMRQFESSQRPYNSRAAGNEAE